MAKVYLSGPMNGYPQKNYPLFNKVAEEMRSAGHMVYNPAEFPHDDRAGPFPIRKAFAAYSAFICLDAEIIAVLPGWEESRGATCEVALAKNCGIPVVMAAELGPA